MEGKQALHKKQVAQATYVWSGTDKKGQSVCGEMQSTQIALVKAQLRNQGIIPKKVSKKGWQLFSERKEAIKSRDIATMSRQLATMIDAGIPLAQSVEIIATGSKNKSVQSLMMTVHHDIESGFNFSDALRKHPKYFNDLFCHLVEAGEKAGALDVMLEKIASYREKAESIKGKIKKALFYPVAVMVFSFLITAGLLIFIVPKFDMMFKNFGAELPLPTQIIVYLSDIFQAYWYLIFSGIGLGVWAFIFFLRRSAKFARLVDILLLKIPIFGSIIQKAAIARFARTLETTFAAGLPLIEALHSAAGATGNALFSEATLKIRDEISTGQTMQQSMGQFLLFPNMVVQMIGIGEEAGSLEKMLGKVADFYEQEVDDAVEGLSSLIEPVVMMVIGGLIGGIVISMYLPIFKLGSVI